MQLSEIYIYALKELKDFDEEAIEKAILLAKNDVVETVEEFIDFINFNIEDKKFPQITQPITSWDRLSSCSSTRRRYVSMTPRTRRWPGTSAATPPARGRLTSTTI